MKVKYYEIAALELLVYRAQTDPMPYSALTRLANAIPSFAAPAQEYRSKIKELVGDKELSECSEETLKAIGELSSQEVEIDDISFSPQDLADIKLTLPNLSGLQKFVVQEKETSE